MIADRTHTGGPPWIASCGFSGRSASSFAARVGTRISCAPDAVTLPEEPSDRSHAIGSGPVSAVPTVNGCIVNATIVTFVPAGPPVALAGWTAVTPPPTTWPPVIASSSANCVAQAVPAAPAVQLAPLRVTADLWESSLDRIPASVSVYDGTALRDGVRHFGDLVDQIPNLTWTGGTSRPRYLQIRGIGRHVRVEVNRFESEGLLQIGNGCAAEIAHKDEIAGASLPGHQQRLDLVGDLREFVAFAEGFDEAGAVFSA